jgi:hypothetical protein
MEYSWGALLMSFVPESVCTKQFEKYVEIAECAITRKTVLDPTTSNLREIRMEGTTG